MDFRMIQKLEKTTPACSLCHSNDNRFVIGCGHQLLECKWCGSISRAPRTLTNLIIAAYQIRNKPTVPRLFVRAL